MTVYQCDERSWRLDGVDKNGCFVCSLFSFRMRLILTDVINGHSEASFGLVPDSRRLLLCRTLRDPVSSRTPLEPTYSLQVLMAMPL